MNVWINDKFEISLDLFFDEASHNIYENTSSQRSNINSIFNNNFFH